MPDIKHNPDLSTELDLSYWQQWFMEVANQIPQGTDSWNLHCRDSLGTYLAGGEL